MPVDFKANQIRTSQIIASGSNSSNAAILVYGVSAATNDSGGYGPGLISGVGVDTFAFVSGSIGSKNSTTRGTAVIGGDVVVSGTIYNAAGSAYSTGGGGTPSSPVNSIQFNNAGSFGGSANLTFESTSNLMSLTGSFGMKGNITPDADFSYNLGTPSKRWQNVYTGDLHLRNDRGDWTILEEEDYLCVINNKTGKKYKMMLQPLD